MTILNDDYTFSYGRKETTETVVEVAQSGAKLGLLFSLDHGRRQYQEELFELSELHRFRAFDWDYLWVSCRRLDFLASPAHA